MKVLIIVVFAFILFMVQSCCLSLRKMSNDEETIIRKIKVIEEVPQEQEKTNAPH